MKKVLMAALALFLLLGQSFLFAEDDFLYAIGSLGASNLYMTFLTIGLLGDSFEKNVYPAETTKDLIDAIISLTKTSQESLNALVAGGEITGEDRATILEMMQAHGATGKTSGGISQICEQQGNPQRFPIFPQKVLGIDRQNSKHSPIGYSSCYIG
jgi:hypothetical protein